MFLNATCHSWDKNKLIPRIIFLIVFILRLAWPTQKFFWFHNECIELTKLILWQYCQWILKLNLLFSQIIHLCLVWCIVHLLTKPHAWLRYNAWKFWNLIIKWKKLLIKGGSSNGGWNKLDKKLNDGIDSFLLYLYCSSFVEFSIQILNDKITLYE